MMQLMNAVANLGLSGCLGAQAILPLDSSLNSLSTKPARMTLKSDCLIYFAIRVGGEPTT